jgi:hypothetical protein
VPPPRRRAGTRVLRSPLMRVEFGGFVLDTDARELRHGSNPVRLSPKAYQLLEILVEARPRALSKSDLMHGIWPDTFVVEANLANLVGEVRAALGDSTHDPRFVRTVHRFGYAFLDVAAPAPRRGGRRVWRARWGDRQVELLPGTHLVGRGEQSIQIDTLSVSRVHARVVAAPDRLTYEDLDSKNGSFRAGEPIRGAIEVASGDVIIVGSVEVTFVLVRASQSTQSVERRTGLRARVR